MLVSDALLEKISIMQPFDLVRNNFIAKASYFTRLIPGMSALDTPSYVLIDSSLPSDTYNAAVLKSTDFDAAKFIAAYYQRKNFPAAIWVWETPDSAVIEQHLIDLQLVTNETNIGMWADLQHIHPDLKSTSDFRIDLVTTTAQLASYADVLAGLFEPSEEAMQVRKYHQLITPFYQAQSSPMQFFIGTCQARVVSTGTLFFEQQTAGIYDIATRADARGKGFGARMFQHLLQATKNQGATTAVLQASPDGLGIYQKAGFQELGWVKVFENRHLLQ